MPTDTPEPALNALRQQLTRRINAAAQPSQLINQLHVAEVRCAASVKILKQLISRAPRILLVVRATLREAFALDPDRLIFTEPSKVHRLTERALALLADPFIAANTNQFTVLSVKDEPEARLPFTARQALERINRLNLLGTLDRAVTVYWRQLADGSWLTRRERWVEQCAIAFAQKAFLARELDQLSSFGFALVQCLIDAPTLEARQRAGGAWALLQVAELGWPRADQVFLAIPGALHLYQDETSPQVIYLPGLAREFYEFRSWQQLQCNLPLLIGGELFASVWQCLPLRRRNEVCDGIGAGVLARRGHSLLGDGLRHSAIAVLDGQWANELACALSINHQSVNAPGEARPAEGDIARFMQVIERGRNRLVSRFGSGTAVAWLLEWDHVRRSREITFASLAPGLPLRTREQTLKRWERALAALSDDKTPGAYQVFSALQAQWQVQVEQAQKHVQAEGERLFQQAYWLERPDGDHKRATLLLKAQHQALMYEARMQQRLKLINEGPLRRVFEVLDKPLAAARNGSDTQVLRLAMNTPGQSTFPLMGAFVVTTRSAFSQPARAQPVVLVTAGTHGGMCAFASLQVLSECVLASLRSPDGSPLWQCIGRDQRLSARRVIGPTSVIEYKATEGNVLHEIFRELIVYHADLYKRLGEKVRLFSEVSDPALGRSMLAGELRQYLQVPASDARDLAIANVQLMQLAAEQAKKLPAWPATTTPARRKEYRRLQTRYLANSIALEKRLWQLLPSLETFTREQLIKQLKEDGVYDGLDIDKPFIEIPDDVATHFCGWSSQCVPGDRHIKTVVSPQRSTYTLLQLALHNLDAQAPWTEWRLNRATYLEPAWKSRLNPRYLIKTLSRLDIGGRYDTLIQQVFYPSAIQQGVSRALTHRTVRQRARMQLFSAVQQGFGAIAQSMFTTAMAAVLPADLAKNGHRLRLYFMRLLGHTLEHPRHIAGMLLIHDELSERCVLYWPAALDYPSLSEFAGLEQARAEVNRVWASQAQVKALAQHIAPGWDAEAVASYPGGAESSPIPDWLWRPVKILDHGILSTYEGIARVVRWFKVKHRVPAVSLEAIEAQIQEQIDDSPTGWLGIVPTVHTQPLVLLAHAQMFDIQRRSQGQSNSAKLLATYRELRLGEQYAARVRGLLSFIPVIGLGISLVEVLIAAKRYHHSRDSHDAVDLAFVTLMAFVDVLASFAPVPKGSSTVVSSVGRASMRGALGQLHRRQALAGVGPSRLAPSIKPFRTLEHMRKERITGGVALQGPGLKGVFVKDGEQFVEEGGHQYAVYRRDNEQVLRLKNPKEKGENELILHIEEPREWLLQADAPEPQPGPSSGGLRPWSVTPRGEPVPQPGPSTAQAVGTQWVAPSHQALLDALRQSPNAPSTWQGWGNRASGPLDDVSPAHRIYRLPAGAAGEGQHLVQLGVDYYWLLPQGTNAPYQKTLFIMKSPSLRPRAYQDVDHWLGVGWEDQPVPATLGANGLWTPHPVLFNEPLERTFTRAFPTMSASSKTFGGRRLVELADNSPSVTATHLLTVKATLDQWTDPKTLGRTDDLLRMLRPVQLSSRASFTLGLDGLAPGFARVDFTPPFVLDASLGLASRSNKRPRLAANQAAVRRVLEQQGFVVRPIGKQPGGIEFADFFCTHPNSGNGYYIYTRWVSGTNVNLSSKPFIRLSDSWFERGALRRSRSPVYPLVLRSLRGGRLVKIVAGIQWAGDTGPTVYFVKIQLIP